ncbi:unnamed protein product [Parajaminaea phylloscopi]
MEATVSGDSYVLSLARFVRANEQSLSGSLASQQRGSNGRPALVPPKPLSLSLHHISYILLRFDALGLAAGSLDDALPASSRPRSTFSYISTGEQKRSSKATANAETASLSSFRSAISRMSISAASTTSSWFSRPTPPSPDQETKYLYSAFTKLPALEVVAPALTGLIEGFDDAPVPTTLTPFDVFKNLQLLSFTDVDPRTVSGWDRLSCQLRSLTLTRTGIEDVEELMVTQVVSDARKRAKAQVSQTEGPDDTTAASVPSSSGSGTSRTDRNADNAAGPTATADDLPSLAWHFLHNLGLPSSSLTFFSILALPSLRALDLSHNLLNAIPPVLSQLPALRSLDLTGNLIEDARGIQEALPAIRTLSLRGNRLESLSGLDRLPMLRNIDLRDNAVYEASEVGRLSQITRLNSVWIKGNPLCEEYPDPRVEVLLEFAKEGWPLEGPTTIVLDGEAAGYFERRRVTERLPLGVSLAPPGATRQRDDENGRDHRRFSTTPQAFADHSGSRLKSGLRATGEEGDSASGGGTAKIVAVKHHHKLRAPDADGSNPKRRGSSRRNVDSHGDESSPSGQPANRMGSEARRSTRHRKRIVDFEGESSDVKAEPVSRAKSKSAERPQSASAQRADPEVSDAERLKRQVLSGEDETPAAAGNGSVASGSTLSRPASQVSPPDGRRQGGTTPSARSSMQRAQNSSSGGDGGKAQVHEGGSVGSSDVSATSPPPSGNDQVTTTATSQQALKVPAGSLAASQSQSHELRARIDRLKEEVGEDWLRVLSRGD